MHLKTHVIILCWISVIYANRSIDLTKCQRNADKNCERLSFRQISQTSNTAVNSSIDLRNVKTDTIDSVDVSENQLVFDQLAIQEDGNLFFKNCLVPHL